MRGCQAGRSSVAMSTPSRPRMPRMSACVVAPLMWLSAPQLYSVMATFRPGAYWLTQSFMRGIRRTLSLIQLLSV